MLKWGLWFFTDYSITGAAADCEPPFVFERKRPGLSDFVQNDDVHVQLPIKFSKAILEELPIVEWLP